MSDLNDYIEKRELGDDAPKILNEASQTSRYSVEVNYRSSMDEIAENAAKVMLGYVSAAMKSCGYHTKVIITAKPMRVLVSTRDWDDGEWVGIVTYNDKMNCFVTAEGSYNKDKKSVSVHTSKKCDGKSAAELVKDLRNIMERLKRTKPVGSNTLHPAELKRGPKPTRMQKLHKPRNPWRKKYT